MIEPNFTPFPAITTARLVLRQLRMEDAAEVFIQRSDPEIQKFIKRTPAANIEEAGDWIKKMLLKEKNNESINWAMVPKTGDRLIGSICLWNIEVMLDRAEVGYSLHPAWFGKGIMREALKAVIHFGFSEMKLKRIDAYTHRHNAASLKLLERADFKRNLAFEENYEDKGELEYNMIYTLLNPDKF